MDGRQSDTGLGETLAQVSDQMPAVLVRARAEHHGRSNRGATTATLRHLAGYLLSVPVGLVMGFVTMALIFGLLPSPGSVASLSEQVMLRALAFGLILSMGPVLAAAAMITLDFGHGHQMGLAAAFSWIAFASCEPLVDLARATFSIIPPDWMLAAAAL